jgi:hypothetical protein
MLLPLLFWWRLWALDPQDRATIPEGDFTGQYYPLHLFAARELAAGRLPAWDPYINGGQPGLADIQTGFYYPLNLLPNIARALLGLPFTPQALVRQVILHFSLASLFTYLLVRHLALRVGARMPAPRFAGAVAALSFTYGGFLTTFPVQQLTILQTAVWLPLVLLFLDRALYAGVRPSQLTLAALALACAILAGHPQTAMYLVYTSLAYALLIVWPARGAGSAPDESKDARRPRGSVLRRAYPVLLALGLGLALAAIQLGPTLQFIIHSTRSDLSYDTVASGFSLAEMTHLLYPGYFGGSPQYVGILPLILAVAALFVRRARRMVVFWIALGIVALVLALGGNTFLYSVTYLLVPGFGAVRNQERIIYLFGFSVAVLAGYGALVLVQPLQRSVRRAFYRFTQGLVWLWIVFLSLTVLFYFGYLQGLQQEVEINMFEGFLRHHILLLIILGGTTALFALRRAGSMRRAGLMALSLGLIWLNLFTVNWRFNLAEPAANGSYAQTGLVAFLKEQPGTFRISSAGLLSGGASAAIVHELEDITGNTPLRLERFQEFEDQIGSWRRWQLLNVHYVLSQKDLEGPGLARVFGEEGVRVYRIGDPFPRAWIVHSALTAADAQAIELLNSEEFDLRQRAILAPEGPKLDLAPGLSPGGPVKILEARPGRLTLEVSPSEEGLLVISQPFYPGWHATVDKEPVPIYRVNYLLQGVAVQAGNHQVELSYRLSPLPALVTVAALACFLLVPLLASRRRRTT